MDFFDAQFEDVLQDSRCCPEDRFILVAPEKPRPLTELDRRCQAVLPEALRPHYGWTLSRVRFRSTHNAVYAQSIFAVSVQRIGDLSFGAEGRAPTDGAIVGTFYFVTADDKTTARFGPRSMVMVDGPMRGRGIGRYTLSQLVGWVQALGFGAAEVVPGRLSEVDAEGDNLKRRNTFYEQGGFDVTYTDAVHGSGRFSAKAIRQLKTHWNLDKVVELSASNLALALQALLTYSGPLAVRLEAEHAARADWQKRYTHAVGGWWKPFLAGVGVIAAAGLWLHFR